MTVNTKDATTTMTVARVSPTALVVGASMSGLFAAAALARSGFSVTILDRDRLPATPGVRSGVPQGGQAHVLLHRGLVGAEQLLPGFRQRLLDAGAVAFDSGRMPWLSEYGWLDAHFSSYEIVSATRPLLEHLVRQDVRALPGVSIEDHTSAAGLTPAGTAWSVPTKDSRVFRADVVVDASGRASRLPHWLAGLGVEVAEPEVVDAHLGYACRPYRAVVPIGIRTGIMIGPSVTSQTAGLALPVENSGWLVAAAGFGDRRPPRDADSFLRFLGDLRDPALYELVRRLEPTGDVTMHRQTANRRYRYESVPDWPDNLLAVGDSACAFNPVYGQGMTVAATQGQILARALADELPVDRRLQRRLATAADVPWGIATAADLRQLGAEEPRNPAQRMLAQWTTQLGRLISSGDPATTLVFSHVYHLMAPPTLLLHPLVLASLARSVVRPPRTGLPRPEVLDCLLPAAAAA